MTVTAGMNRATAKSHDISNVKRLIAYVPVYVLLLIWTVLVVLPLLWLIYSAFKTNQELYASVWGLPAHLEWDNFARAWRKGGLGWALFSSLF